MSSYDDNVIDRPKIGCGRHERISKEALHKKPSSSRIMFFVCSCYQDQTLKFILVNLKESASILGVEKQKLEEIAITAMVTKEPQLVVNYASKDVAETKLNLLRQVGPLLENSCHGFFIQE